MPNVPKWVADQMENLLSSKYLDIEVSETAAYGQELKKVTFLADLHNVNFYPGSSMIFRASDRELRHYTPYAFDRERGSFDVIFHIHGNGPGCLLANRLMPGDHLKVSAPGGKKLYDKDSAFHYFFGDETSLGFYFSLIEETKRNGQWSSGVLELNEKNLHIPKELGCDITTVLRSPDAAASGSIKAIRSAITTTPELLQSIFYLTGNVASVQKLRSTLKSMGIASKNIKLQGYWAEGSIGL